LFLGETFSAVIAIHNETSQVASKVNLKVELLTRNHRHVLLHPFFIQQVDGGGSVEKVVMHEVHELEEHSLVVSVSYTHINGEETLMKRSFRIPVIKPLDVKTTHCAVEEEGDILFEIQIENLMPSPFVLEVFKFEPAENCTVVSCSDSYPGDDCLSVFGHHKWIKPRNTRQYLYKITPSFWPSPKVARDGNTYCSIKVGKVDIAWMSSYGEKGRIQTSPLEAKVERSREFLAQVCEVPGQVLLEQPFTATCLLKNISKSNMLLKTVFPQQHTGGILWSGLSGTEIGELATNSQKEVTFTLIPIRPGLQDITGLEFIDMISSKTYLLKRTRVFVQVEQAMISS
jgi:hypothetical protein